MFEETIGNEIYEVSHKLLPSPDASSFRNHIHSYCELLLFISGNATLNVDGQLFTPRPYDLFFIPKATYHYIAPQVDTPYENYVIDLAPELMTQEQYDGIFSPPRRLNIRQDGELCRFFTRLDLYRERYSDADFSQCALCLIKELLVYCSYIPRREQPTERPTRRLVSDIVEYVADNLESPLNADIIAKHFYLSKSYIQNVFAEEMRIGLKQYILRKKVFAAENDLRSGVSPGDVCKKYSFSDYTSFYRLYRRFFSGSPRSVSAHSTAF